MPRPRSTTALAQGGISAAILLLLLMLPRIWPLNHMSLLMLVGLLMVLVVMLLGVRRAALVYLAVSILSILFYPSAHTVLFALLFGLYPLLKAVIEQRYPERSLQWLGKLVYFGLVWGGMKLMVSMALVPGLALLFKRGLWFPLFFLAGCVCVDIFLTYFARFAWPKLQRLRFFR